jgi:prolyl-tRNA editing enzyme YbaK/EbsC (Cys-tRNA(Pro) deacylase)
LPDLTDRRPGDVPLTERLQEWLREAGVLFEVLEHAPVSTSEDAARVRGTPLEQGAKALVVRADTASCTACCPRT